MVILIELDNLSFYNSSADQGGALYFDNLNYNKSLASAFNLNKCTFFGNTANYGGAIYSNDSFFDIKNTQFTEN